MNASKRLFSSSSTSSKSWTEEENAILIGGRERRLKYTDLAKDLPGRTAKAIYLQGRRLGATATRWTAAEVDAMAQGFKDGKYASELAKTTGRSTHAILRARRRFFKTSGSSSTSNDNNDYPVIRSYRQHRWTEDENALLRECSAKKMDANSMCKLFPQSSHDALRRRLQQLGLTWRRGKQARVSRWWTTEEDAIFEEYKHEGLNRVAERCNRSPKAVLSRSRKLSEVGRQRTG